MKNSIAIILAIFVLVVSFLSFTNTPVVVKTFTAIKGGLSIAIGPALKVIGRPIDGIRGVFNTYINLIDTKKRTMD